MGRPPRRPKLTWKDHAIDEMRQDELSPHDVEHVLDYGTIIEEVYRSGRRYPTRIYLAYVRHEPVHVVCGVVDEDNLVVVTAYKCDP